MGFSGLCFVIPRRTDPPRRGANAATTLGCPRSRNEGHVVRPGPLLTGVGVGRTRHLGVPDDVLAVGWDAELAA